MPGSTTAYGWQQLAGGALGLHVVKQPTWPLEEAAQ